MFEKSSHFRDRLRSNIVNAPTKEKPKKLCELSFTRVKFEPEEGNGDISWVVVQNIEDGRRWGFIDLDGCR